MVWYGEKTLMTTQHFHLFHLDFNLERSKTISALPSVNAFNQFLLQDRECILGSIFAVYRVLLSVAINFPIIPIFSENLDIRQ